MRIGKNLVEISKLHFSSSSEDVRIYCNKLWYLNIIYILLLIMTTHHKDHEHCNDAFIASVSVLKSVYFKKKYYVWSVKIFVQGTKLNSDAGLEWAHFYHYHSVLLVQSPVQNPMPPRQLGKVFGYSKHGPQEWDQTGLTHITCSPGMPWKCSRAWLQSVVKTHVKIQKELHMKAKYIENRGKATCQTFN